MSPGIRHTEFQPLSGRHLTDYRAYTIGMAGRIIGYEPLVCGNDEEAIEKATGLVSKHDIELWSGERLVVRLSSRAGAVRDRPAKGQPSQGQPRAEGRSDDNS